MALDTYPAEQQPLPMSTIEQILVALANPILLGILLTIGVQAILIEISHPGGWVAGLVGVLCLGIALYGIGQLPVNWLGLGLVLVAFVLFVLEVKAATHGALSATGIAVLVAGLLVLFNSPVSPDFLSISLPAAIAISASTGLFFVFVVSKALRAQGVRTTTGPEGLIGRTGPVRTSFASPDHKAPYTGLVQVAGELWRAQANEEFERGEEVVVSAMQGFTLTVQKATKKVQAADGEVLPKALRSGH
jgi:membrane-bound serine protease (ClpP class)